MIFGRGSLFVEYCVVRVETKRQDWIDLSRWLFTLLVVLYVRVSCAFVGKMEWDGMYCVCSLPMYPVLRYIMTCLVGWLTFTLLFVIVCAVAFVS